MKNTQKWLAVVGTREVDDEIRADIETYVMAKFAEGYSIVSGGATGADHEAARIAYSYGLGADRFRIYLPVELQVYCDSLVTRGRAGKCRLEDANETTDLLGHISATLPGVISDKTPYIAVDAESFHARNCQVVDLADELVAFRTNMSPGTTFTIEQAQTKSIPVMVFDYKRL